MVITIASRKNKARKLQQLVASEILNLFPELTERDVRSTPMGCAGADIQLSEIASKKFPYSVECKRRESISIWASLKQTESNTKERDLTPLLVFKRSNEEPYCALKFKDFINLLKVRRIEN